MKKNVNNILVLLVIMMILLTLVACKREENGTTLADEVVGSLGDGVITEVKEEKRVELHTKHDVDFDGMTLVFTPKYTRSQNWTFTQSSSVDLQLGTEHIPKDVEVLVSQVYSDISLVSKYSRYNGIRQDSVNVEYYSLPTGGISIRESDPYTLPFQVEAVDKSETFFYSYNGYGSTSTIRVKESDLRDNVEGVVLNVVWTILIKDVSTGNLYVKTINDRVGIPYVGSN